MASSETNALRDSVRKIIPLLLIPGAELGFMTLSAIFLQLVNETAFPPRMTAIAVARSVDKFAARALILFAVYSGIRFILGGDSDSAVRLTAIAYLTYCAIPLVFSKRDGSARSL